MRAIALQRRRLERDLRDAANDLGIYLRERQDTQAAIRRAEHASNEREATRLRRELPVIERAISRANRNHDKAKAALQAFEARHPRDS